MRNPPSKKFGVTITVNGKPWRRVASLVGSGPRDRMFTVAQRAGGKTVVQFGDGVHGARPRIGAKITVSYRTAAGAAGNTTTVILQRTASPPTLDQTLWVAIRNRSHMTSFEFRERRKSN